ncbi:hypothetical protein [Oceanobacillus caeni]|uniref:hypothetical protein n=1 Tax=Oceanobacillus caeni TaxID=405946 RepID=UPI0036D336B9
MLFVKLTEITTISIPRQASKETKKVGGRSIARKNPIGATNRQWGMKENPQ